MIVALALVATILALLASGLLSGSEMGLYCINRVRLRLRGENRNAHDARTLMSLVNRQQESVLAILLGQNLANYLLTVAATFLMVRGFGLESGSVEFYSAAILSPLAFVFGDVVPKNWFQAEADRLMYRAAPLLQAAVRGLRMTGVLWLLLRVTRLSARLTGHEEDERLRGPRGEVIGLLREGAAEGALSHEQAEIVERVMNLSSVSVGSIMIPRRRVATVPVATSRTQFLHAVRGHSYSRMPVVDRDGKSVVGIISVCDALAEESDIAVEKAMHPPTILQAHDSAARALIQLQQTRETMAVVNDPRRGFVGIITLKDIVEEIFGELPA
jgi:putative hemolysin